MENAGKGYLNSWLRGGLCGTLGLVELNAVCLITSSVLSCGSRRGMLDQSRTGTSLRLEAVTCY